MSEIKRALKILRAHTVPENCNAVEELRSALLQEIKYWGADYLHGEKRQDARLHHAQQADACWWTAGDLFSELNTKKGPAE